MGTDIRFASGRWCNGMKDIPPFEWRGYMASTEVLQGAIQQMSLIPLDEMESFLRESIEATDPSTELSRKKIAAALRQLRLIAASRRYISEVRALLQEDTR